MTPGPAVGSDGTIYAASNAGILHALDPVTGADRWTYDGGGPYGSDLSTTPAVLGDGVVLWPGPGASLHAVDATAGGAPLWRLPLAGFVLSPAVLDDGRVVVADMTGRVVSLRWPGADHREPPLVAWTAELGGPSYGSPAAASGAVYATAGPDLVALNAVSGAVAWRVTTGALIEVSPAVAPDGTIVVASNDPFTYGVAPDGAVRWRHRRGALSFSSPAATASGLVVAGDHRAGLDVVEAASGRLLGRFQGQGPRRPGESVGVWTAPVVDGAHRVYAGTRHGHIYGFTPSGRGMFDLDVGATVDSYPALTADGALIVGVSDGRLLAVADDTPCTAARRAGDGGRLVYAANRPDALRAVVVDRPVVALGIDDGPDPTWTPMALRVLARHRARATFFVIGDRAREHPGLVRAAAAAGHEVGLHTMAHVDVVGRAASGVAADVRATRAAVAATGVEPVALLRPPHGVQDGPGAEGACRAGVRTVGWSVNVVRTVSGMQPGPIEPGAILLAHDGRLDRRRELADLDRLLATLTAQGLGVVPVGELLAAGGVSVGR